MVIDALVGVDFGNTDSGRSINVKMTPTVRISEEEPEDGLNPEKFCFIG